MTNLGDTPPDFSAPIGMFRLLAQDTNYVPLSPAVAGQGSYDLFSDAEVTGYIAMFAGFSLFRAVGAAYAGLAGRASMEAKIAKDYDLQVDLTKRAEALQSMAQAFLAQADHDDELSGVLSTFGITAPDATPSLAELTNLPMEQWAVLNDIDLPSPIIGFPPYLWNW